MPVDNFAFLLPVIMTIFGAVFLIIAHRGVRQSLFWGCGFLCCAVAFTLPYVFAWLPGQVQALITDALFTTAFFCYGNALVLRFCATPVSGLRIGLALAGYAVIVYTILVLDSLRAELIASDLVSAGILLMAIVMSVRHVKRPVDRLLLVASSLVVTETLVRTTIFIFSTTTSDAFESFATSEYAFILQSVATVGALQLALAALSAVTFDVIDRYRDAAERDVLTGLLNRRGLDEAIAGLARGKHTSIAVISCDIDHFKHINDTWGHATGDRVLQGVAEIMRTVFPSGTKITRMGGEEFVALLPGHDMDVAIDIANMIRLAIAGRDWNDMGIDSRITASLGIDAVGPGDHTIYEAIGRADTGLYAAKNGGRNLVATRSMIVSGEPSLRFASRQS